MPTPKRKIYRGIVDICDGDYAGTPRGHRAHLKNKEDSCLACREAFNYELKILRFLKGQTTAMTLTGPELADLLTVVWEKARQHPTELSPYRFGDPSSALSELLVGRL